MRKIALLDYLRLLLISTLVGRAAGVASVAGVQKPLVATQAAPIVYAILIFLQRWIDILIFRMF